MHFSTIFQDQLLDELGNDLNIYWRVLASYLTIIASDFKGLW